MLCDFRYCFLHLHKRAVRIVRANQLRLRGNELYDEIREVTQCASDDAASHYHSIFVVRLRELVNYLQDILNHLRHVALRVHLEALRDDVIRAVDLVRVNKRY